MNYPYESLLGFAAALLLFAFLLAVCIVCFAMLCPTEDCDSWFERPRRRHRTHCGSASQLVVAGPVYAPGNR